MERLTGERFNTVKEIAHYANAGFSKERIAETLREVVSELQKYRDAEEAGLLIKLPVKIGTPVYIVWAGMCDDACPNWNGKKCTGKSGKCPLTVQQIKFKLPISEGLILQLILGILP